MGSLSNLLKRYLQEHPSATAADLVDLAGLVDRDYNDRFEEDYWDYEEPEEPEEPIEYDPPTPFTLSEKVLRDNPDPQVLLTDSWLYIYGYCGDSPIEETLCIAKTSNSSGEIIGEVLKSGLACRFELVSAKDLFYYGGGSIGDCSSHALPMCNTYLPAQSSFIATNFSFITG